MSLAPLKNKNVLKELEKTISPVLVVNNSSLKPYVELFEYEPENIYQQPLGSLVGFFEVKEFSEDSAYIVNHLTAVLKKEYYINPKRPVTESLDSALHKVNMALSEIARIGNVQWLGKINAAICVLEKNNAHFSVSGNAKIFLYRNNILSEISEDLASDSLEPHPLKTFINVSSGRLETSDRLLITSEDIFHILPVTELSKNFQRLEGEKFVQFLKTALSNQLEMIASVVIEMTEVAPVIAKKTSLQKKPSKITNVFSEQTFANSKKNETLAQDEQFDEPGEIVSDPNYTDKKTGHIYIQGETMDTEKNTNSQIHLYQDLAKEKISQAIFSTKNELRKRFSLYKKQLAKKRALRQAEKEKQAQLAAQEAERLAQQRALEEIAEQQRLSEQREFEKERLEQEMIAKQESERLELIKQAERQKIEQTKHIEVEQVEVNKPEETIVNSPTDKFALSFREKLERAKLEQQKQASVAIDLVKPGKLSRTHQKPNEEFEEDAFNDLEIETEPEEKESKLSTFKSLAQDAFSKTSPILEKVTKSVSANIKNNSAKTIEYLRTSQLLKSKGAQGEESKNFSFVPHFSKIKQLFSKFTIKQKTYTFLALALIFIVPLFIVKFLNKPETPTITNLQIAQSSQADVLANEKNINLQANIQNIFANKNIVASLIANNIPTAVTKTSIVLMRNGEPKEFPLPSDLGTPVKATYMSDLSLIFIITDASKVISFSPVSEKFTQSNNIDLSSISPTSFIGTYLTYLYVLDQKTNQIYRFPRAEGGFGEKSNWLKDSAPLSNSSDMTIDDNIYTVSDNKVLKFFKGKAVPFSLETSNTPVVFDKLYTTPELQSLYALDVQNSRIVQYSKDGSIIAQFHDDTLKDGFSLSVDEKNKVAYLATSSGLVSLSLQ